MKYTPMFFCAEDIQGDLQLDIVTQKGADFGGKDPGGYSRFFYRTIRIFVYFGKGVESATPAKIHGTLLGYNQGGKRKKRENVDFNLVDLFKS